MGLLSNDTMLLLCCLSPCLWIHLLLQLAAGVFWSIVMVLCFKCKQSLNTLLATTTATIGRQR